MMDRNLFKYWETKARHEIHKFLVDPDYADHVCKTVQIDNIGPFTKLLYNFAIDSKTCWGLMIDFNERHQRIFLVDKYYKWMHALRDEIKIIIEKNINFNKHK